MKLALVLHGWPQEVSEEHSLVKLLKKKNYQVIKPYFLIMAEKLDLKNILRKVDEVLNGKIPDVIVGMSMSGFWLPNIAQKYPMAKIIIVASGARFAPKAKMFGNFAKVLSVPIFGEMFAWVVLQIAPIYMKWWYKQLTSNGKSGRYVQADIDQSVNDVRKIDFRKHAQLARMIVAIDNGVIWKNLKNEILILSGSEDIVMPVGLGKELAELTKNSKLVVTKASHFDVLNRETYTEISNFLSSNN